MPKSITVKDCFPNDWLDVFDPRHGRIGAGLDVATTTKKKSNPSAFAVTQQIGLTYFARLTIRLKTGDGDVLHELIDMTRLGLYSRGLKIRRLCIDATSERFFAASLQKKLRGKLSVELVNSAEATTYLGERMNYKAYLGNLLANTFEGGYMAIAEQSWLKDDLRQPYRDGGTFASDVDENGNHADCFDAYKLSIHALKGSGGPAEAAGAPSGHGDLKHGLRRSGLKNPLLKHQRHQSRNYT